MEEYAAPTDVVECTPADHPYHLPGANVVLWDVPGYDTQKVPFGEDYLRQINFESYDFYIHVSCSKIEETELLLHSAIARQGKRYFYVRTKIDRDLKNLKKAHPRTFNADHEKEGIRTKIEECFPDVPVFLVSSFDTESHDLPTLRSLMEDGANFSLRSHRDIVKRKLQGTGRATSRFLENFCVLQ
ncbi:T-cell-specific guanine nucleotide triphosphate-binding protein 2-like [Haliotis asinina]|uniref:T-cell-specific guanine nucleotide triphosphate-binding protein 2-like n=1 Tax=Haliotis asinina TaxID=109174 RepID=UPI003531CD1D